MPGQFTIIRQSNSSLELIAKQTEAQEWIQSVINVQFPSDDFGKAIEDGIFLCRLANQIQPGIIKKIITTGIRARMIQENLLNFTNALRQLGLEEITIFHPTDLSARKNMMKVVNAIHILADVAAKNGFEPKMVRLIPDDFTFKNTQKNAQRPSSKLPGSPRSSKPPKPEGERKKVTIMDIADDGVDEALLFAKNSPREETQLESKQEEKKPESPRVEAKTEDKKPADDKKLEEEKKKKLEADKKKQEEEKIKKEKEQKALEEKKKADEEKAKKEKELKAKKEQEDKLKKEKEEKEKLEKLKKEQDEKIKKEQEEKLKKEQEEKAKKEQEDKSKKVEEKPKTDAARPSFKKNLAEHRGKDDQQKEEEAKKQKELDEKIRKEKEEKQKQDREEAERQQKEKEEKRKEEDRKRKEEEERKREEERIKLEEQAKEEKAKQEEQEKEKESKKEVKKETGMPDSKTRSWKGRRGTKTLEEIESQYKNISDSNSESDVSSPPMSPQSDDSSSSYSSLSDSNKSPESGPKGDGLDKVRSWKRRTHESPGSATSSPGGSLRRSWRDRRGSTIKDIEQYYQSLKVEAEKVNKSELLEEQIKKNKEELIEEMNKDRVEFREVNEEEKTEEEEQEDNRERMRVEVISEILISERYYVRDLEIVVNSFLKPIIEENILNKEEVEALFSNVDLITKVNKEMLNFLLNDFQTAGNIQLMNIGSIFLKLADYLKIYSIYASNQAAAIKIYDQFKKEKKSFADFLLTAEGKSECQGLNLLGFLIKPVQRICKYPLLFRELLKYTSKDHMDYENLEKCLSKVQEVAEYVNEKQKTIESLKKMMEIQENLIDAKGFSVVAPARRFIKEGYFIKVNHRGKQQERLFFLFNDILLYCRPQFLKKTTFQYKGVIPLNVCLVGDLPDTDELQNQIELSRWDNKKKYLILAETAGDKRTWLEVLNRIIDQYLQKEKAARKSVM